MGTGSSGKSSVGNQSKSTPMRRGEGIAILQGAVAKAKTSDLMSAYRAIESKPLLERTNEEKMVRATAIDELANRGALIYDPKTEDFVENKSKDRVVFAPSVIGTDGRDTGARSYRIHGFETVEMQNVRGDVTKAEVAISDFYYNGQWREVRNRTVQREVAALYRAEQRRRKK